MWTLSRRIDTSVPLSLDGYDILVEEQFARIHGRASAKTSIASPCAFLSATSLPSLSLIVNSLPVWKIR